MVHDAAGVEVLSGLSGFRDGFYECLTARADALFELADAAICADGPVTSLVELSLAPVFRRGHGALYDALAGGGEAPGEVPGQGVRPANPARSCRQG